MPESCTITITASGVTVVFDTPIPDGPHKLSRVEALAGGAIAGVAQAMQGKGALDVLKVVRIFQQQEDQ